MALNDTISQPVERHINWGGVLKGVAIVTAVAVAAVVGVWAFTALSTYVTGAIASNATASALAAGVQSGAASAAQGVSWLVNGAVNLLSGIPAGLANILGLTGSTFTQAAAVNETVGILGGAAVGITATHAAIPHLQHTNFVDVTPSTHGHTEIMTTALPMHDITHMTHHAAEHANEHAGAAWSEKFAPRAATYGSFADNVRAQKEERKAEQPAASFTEQLNTDRANLDAALAK